ncbi:MAG: hypothetical protein AB7S41_01355 [Parvibaculaceae bacterium]
MSRLDTASGISKRYGVTHVGANVDSLDIFVRTRPKRIYDLYEISPPPISIIREHFVGDAFQGYMIVNDKLDLHAIEWLAEMQRACAKMPDSFRLKPSMLHVGCEYVTETRRQAEALQQHVSRRLRLLHNRQRGIHVIGSTHYWSFDPKYPKRPKQRSLISYSDLSARTTNADDAFRLELRLRGEAIKDLELDDISKIARINPYELFDRTMKWVTTDAIRKWAEYQCRKMTFRSDSERERHMKQIIANADRFSLNVERRFDTSDQRGILEIVPRHLSDVVVR